MMDVRYINQRSSTMSQSLTFKYSRLRENYKKKNEFYEDCQGEVYFMLSYIDICLIENQKLPRLGLRVYQLVTLLLDWSNQ